MTVEPPAVHPSLGLMAFMQGVATGRGGYSPTTKNRIVHEKIYYCNPPNRNKDFFRLCGNIGYPATIAIDRDLI